MFEDLVDCKNVTVFSPEVLYPIGTDEWEILFNSSRNDVKEKIKNNMSQCMVGTHYANINKLFLKVVIYMKMLLKITVQKYLVQLLINFN